LIPSLRLWARAFGIDADVERLIAGAAAGVPDAAATVTPDDPELLPLRDRAEATRLLAQRESVAPLPSRRCRVVIASTFTAQPLIPSLRLWARAFGIDADVEVTDFDQLEAALLSPSGVFRTAPIDSVRVVLVRAEELAADPSARLARARGLLDAIQAFATDRVSLVVGSLPPPLTPTSASERSQLDELRAEWRQRLESVRGVEILDVAGVVERLGSVAAGNPASEATSRLPWSAGACRDLGIEVARSVRRRFRLPAKVVAVDCDGTLWRGVVAEDGVEGLGVGADGTDRAFQLFQQRLRDLKERGVLIALVSRNEEADVWRVFDEHPGMVLRREDIAAWRIGWQPKSQMLTELTNETGLSADAFVFLDDDPAVRMEVEANAPGVLVVPLPAEPADRLATLAALWCFDGAEPTAVDQARTQMLRAERDRQQVKGNATDMASYLRDLGLVVSIHGATDAELPRLAQLTQRTNQFNTSLRRRSLDEMRALGHETTVLSLLARDRFGEYGLVGMAILEAEGTDSVRLDTLLMSCRALGRGIEHVLLHVVAETARGRGANCLRAAWTKGPRNGPAIGFLRESGFVEESEGTLAVGLDRAFELPSHICLEAEWSQLGLLRTSP
ncbi:MAG TPA: HAD-IIIC family phosphatase, partial [Candidatus Saccharimonadales bacterium]|nr:HAD-IIIC family phosphatase [Candidatus Saccharimonadales bacterium]